MLRGLNSAPRLNHLGLGQHLRLPEYTRRRPVRRPLLRDELALGRGVCDVATRHLNV